jgi:ribose 5-phosphate isomerase B
MRISIGSDHAGYAYKEEIKRFLAGRGHEVIDFGTNSEVPCDYPLFIRPAAEAVASGRCDRAIVLGGSGNGEAMVANRVRGVRCALCWDVQSARMARAHNDANCLALGQRLVPLERALKIVETWLATPFDGGRHARRIAMIDAEAQPQPGNP